MCVGRDTFICGGHDLSRMIHITRMNESCHTLDRQRHSVLPLANRYEGVPVTQQYPITHMNESHHAYEFVAPYMGPPTSHHTYESRHTYERVMSHI